MACTETVYIENATSLKERLTRIDQIILALELNIINSSADVNHIDSYMLDDGQTKIQTRYRSIDSAQKAIEGFERLRQKIINQLNGRQIVLRPWEGLKT